MASITADEIDYSIEKQGSLKFWKETSDNDPDTKMHFRIDYFFVFPIIFFMSLIISWIM